MTTPAGRRRGWPLNGEHRIDRTADETPRLRQLDGVRGLAALGVLVFHCIYFSGYWGSLYQRSHVLGAFVANAANFCVSVFFVLSGFLLFREFLGAIIFDQQRVSTRHYVARRFLRIYPAYWAALLGVVVLIGGEELRGHVFGLVTLTERNLNNAVTLPGIPVAWTLYIEVAFYVFLPIAAAALMRLCRRKPVETRIRIVVGALIAMAGFSMLWVFLVDRFADGDPRLMVNLPTYLCWFAAGMALSLIVRCREQGLAIAAGLTRLAQHPWWCWGGALAANVAIAGMKVLASTEQSAMQIQIRLAALGVASFLVLLPLVMSSRPSLFHRTLGSSAFMGVGLVSYGLYLWHLIVIDKLNELHRFGGTLGGTITLLSLVLPISLLLGWISFRIIERPAMSLAPPPPTGSVGSEPAH